MKAYSVILLAAGQGKRMQAGKNKQFLSIAGTPLLIHTIRVFEGDSLCRHIQLVVNDQETEEIRELLREWETGSKAVITTGGRERQDSVAAGLQQLRENDPRAVVMIHDAARPFVQSGELHRLAEAAALHGGAILGAPVKDTIKEVEDGSITKTTDRSRLWAAQTPQAFHDSVIRGAHEAAAAASYTGTDDASLVEWHGGRVRMVQGSYENFKVTTPEDLLFAEAVLKHRQQGGRTT
ncbi:2-C-methyl-D-erythritol 4-phosphate cytidylyltransferase [Alkalicoccus chagannorensis]|uniref:2-C-methyl-D-erythritol 4-phosphate cytidylyltransferase n=1 Tax=Alkalicoccus chagannorensis TaxID=427072 RepID=UPI00040FD25C|nr:2-C-methyl-D-erythritol 4-phosphate cytidylyltransferase [Alkalicoccus chagannorensis]